LAQSSARANAREQRLREEAALAIETTRRRVDELLRAQE
jgi:hypothetical protein